MSKTKLLQFKNYLQDQKLSNTSIKNYLSDIRHFYRWSAKRKILVLEKAVLEKYKQNLIQDKKPIKTINRYLASLRKYGCFLHQKGLMQQNPAKSLTNYKLTQGQDKARRLINTKNSPKLLSKFKNYLAEEKIKPTTVKNYLSDVNQFLNWLKTS